MGALLFILLILSPFLFGLQGTVIIAAALWIGWMIYAMTVTALDQ